MVSSNMIIAFEYGFELRAFPQKACSGQWKRFDESILSPSSPSAENNLPIRKRISVEMPESMFPHKLCWGLDSKNDLEVIFLYTLRLHLHKKHTPTSLRSFPMSVIPTNYQVTRAFEDPFCHISFSKPNLKVCTFLGNILQYKYHQIPLISMKL